MRIAVDTNVLVRAVVRDDSEQYEAATGIMGRADTVALALPCLCELVWVLRCVYRFQPADVGKAIRILTGPENVEANRPAVEAGLAMLDAGGDFADGAIAYEGRWLGGETFVSFDRQAVAMLKAQGQSARLL
ncbi:MAG TPA: type II toxin-antitoxin system VapC family toxin [Terriglobales bacterium]